MNETIRKSGTTKTVEQQRRCVAGAAAVIEGFRRMVADLPDLVEALGEGKAFSRLSRQAGELAGIWRVADATQKAALKEQLQAAVLELMLQSPFFRRCYEKPRGYAGDYLMMLLIWQGRTRPDTHRYCGETRLGQLINAWLLDFDNSAANEERVNILKRYLMAYGGGVVASVGAGAMLEGSEALGSGCSPQTIFHLYDRDTGAIEHATSALSLHGAAVVPHAGGVAKSVLREPPEPSYDLCYSSGLYDYFKLPSARRLTEVLWSRVRPAGTLLVTNAHPKSPSRMFMDAVAEWPLQYKTREQMWSLGQGLPCLAARNLAIDSHGVYQYLSLRKQG